MSADLPVLSFVDLPAWERWLKKHGNTSAGIWMKLAKAGAPEPTLEKPKAIEGSLCHGWINGQITKLDDHCFLVRFTRRSALNRSSAQRLIEAGRMSECARSRPRRPMAVGRLPMHPRATHSRPIRRHVRSSPNWTAPTVLR